MNISHKIKENFYDDIPSEQFWEFLSKNIEDKIIIDKLKVVPYIVGQMTLHRKYQVFMMLYLLKLITIMKNFYK